MIKYLPNILTITRIILVPVFAYLFFSHTFIYKLYSVIIFCIASLTDFFDGKIARKYKIESNLGKFLDPLADKMLVLTAYFCIVFIPEYKIPFWIILIILFRELSLTGMRMLAISQNKILKTSKLGKLKTTTQMITILFIFILMLFKTYMIEKGYITLPKYYKTEKFWSYFFGNFLGNMITYAPLILVLIATFITLYSGLMYIIANKDLFKTK